MTDRSATLPTKPQTPPRFHVDGRDFENAEAVIRYLVAEHTKAELVDLLIAMLDTTAIEAAARQQGREEAVRGLRDDLPQWFPCSCISAYRDRGLEAPDCPTHDIARWFDEALDAIATQGGEPK